MAKRKPGRTQNLQCPLCPSSFKHRAQLQQHISSHVKEKFHECSYCNFKTHSEASLSGHIKHLHMMPMQLNCPFPGCKFLTIYDGSLRTHLQIHDPNRRSFPCPLPQCEHRASSAGSLKQHIRARHNPGRNKEFSCTLCPKNFYFLGSLQGHINSVHTKESYYKCEKCNFSAHSLFKFRQHGQNLHWESHNGRDKKFRCASCEYRARYRYQLDAHSLRTHGSVVPAVPVFTCILCNFEGENEYVVLKHSASHRIPVVMLERLILELK